MERSVAMGRKTRLFCGWVVAVLLAVSCAVSAAQCEGLEGLEPVYRAEEDSPYFQTVTGCAVFYSETENVINVYNQELAALATAPNSTFKILSCLMGLESGAIDPEQSTISWDGFAYPLEAWNRDLDYKQAFRVSAIWYYRQVLDRVGPDFVQSALDRLSYGNCDISAWEGGGNLYFPEIRDLEAVNGFWQESSLRISPLNLVDVLYRIFHDGGGFGAENIALVMDVMLTDTDIEGLALYGKTGTGVQSETWTNAWFTGLYEYRGDTVYFAVRENEPNTTGQYAKEIALRIIDDRTRE